MDRQKGDGQKRHIKETNRRETGSNEERKEVQARLLSSVQDPLPDLSNSRDF